MFEDDCDNKENVDKIGRWLGECERRAGMVEIHDLHKREETSPQAAHLSHIDEERYALKSDGQVDAHVTDDL